MKNLVVDSVFHPSDLSEGDRVAFKHALRIAVAAQAELTLLHAGADAADVHWSSFPHVRETLNEWQMLQQDPSGGFHALGLRVAKVKKSDSDPVRATLAFTETHRPDLVVLSTHQRHGIDRWLHKALSEPIARGARTMTLFVPREGKGIIEQDGSIRLRKVLIPVDTKPSPQYAIDVATALPAFFEVSPVHFVIFHAGPAARLPRFEERLPAGLTVEETAWEGPAVEHILQASAAQEIDLIVMATAGHKGFLDAVRGSTTERVVREAKCPVLAVPAAGIQ